MFFLYMFWDSSSVNGVFETLRFRDGLVWLLGLAGRNKPASLNSSGAMRVVQM